MSPCESCHAGCCRSFAVPISGADIVLIEQQVGLSFWEFACRWADPSGNIARQYAPHFHFSDEPGTPFVICLIHEQSHFLKGTTKCRFLVECAPDEESPLGQARCGIYNARPGACRAFPTRLNESGELAIIHEVPSNGRSEEDTAYDLCPRQWEPGDFDHLQTVQSLVVAKYEITFFHQLADLWNRNPRAWSVFPEFLHYVYNSRVQGQSAATALDAEPTTFPLSNTGEDENVRKAA